MRELLMGIVDFRRRIRPRFLPVFEKLARTQKPNCLFVACSDSRVVPNLFASTNPGELFTVRNVGNLVAPKGQIGNRSSGDESEIAAMEFSIENLGVENIVVCGHSECGAMKAVVATQLGEAALTATEISTTCSKLGHNHSTGDIKTPHLYSWLRHAYPSFTKLHNSVKVPLQFLKADKPVYAEIDRSLPLYDQLSQINAIQQLEHISNYDIVYDRVRSGKLQLHAWWFDIGKADVYSFSEKKRKYILIDESKAVELLERYGVDVTNRKFEDSSRFTQPNWTYTAELTEKDK